MWSNLFVQQEEDGRMGVVGAGQGGGLAGMKGLRGQRRTNKMSDSQEGKIKLAFFVAIVGVTLTVLGMGTEFWVELAQPKDFSGNQTCQMAHYGLWKGCVRTLWVADIDPERTSCGPAELPGEGDDYLHDGPFLSKKEVWRWKRLPGISESRKNPTAPTSNSSPLGRTLSYSRRRPTGVRCFIYPLPVHTHTHTRTHTHTHTHSASSLTHFRP
ncbi:voltage-dependent calcium channel gamma-6 subunit isoform X5 [Nothobranchius furzeri]|uniref:voltage-dependent calcium channel gamma-6 subunit isoform X5 n=1 Tax=Nothobranchius furzeri TaxID=105023 RepID=UPI003904A074